ncbi:hypothetical protein PG997_009968 [Apiospora hydei]|uniref:Uncharacterized protein n=1 Tax=Apiospora hydei TaxID=1337664 RepID=A0ABR1VYP9_9PEZI
MDQSARLEELREGSTPASPPKLGRPELAPGWGRPMPGESVTGYAPEMRIQQTSAEPYALANTNYNQYVNTLDSSRIMEEQAIVPFVPSESVNEGIDAGQDMSQQQLVRTGPAQMVTGLRAAFRPRHVADLATGFYHTLRDGHSSPRISTGGYRGTMRAEASRAAENDNCCLFLTGFPAHITVREFIHQTQAYQLGKIAAVHITAPSANHSRAAIKATMWNREGAVRLRHAIESQQIRFDGYNLRALWNRHRVAPQTAADESCVILVIGRPEQFGEHFTFKLDRLIVKSLTTDIMFVEYSFGSYVNQASNAYRLIRDTFDSDHVLAVYRNDPCEPELLRAVEQ